VTVHYESRSKKISTLFPSKSSWLIKFPAQNEHKEVAAIEALYASLARHAGLDVSETEYFDLGKTLAAFGTKRFDREGNFKIPTHTLAGMLDANFRIPSAVDYLSFLRLIQFVTKDSREVLKGFRHCVFNIVFHNRDDHPKNFSFLLDQKRNWKLSPAYDLTYSTGPRGEHHMDICGEGRDPGKKHLYQLAEKSGIGMESATQVILQVIEAASQFKQESKNLPIRLATVNAIFKTIQTNLRRLI
jgi:serine/threonine-protein kinase HipA